MNRSVISIGVIALCLSTLIAFIFGYQARKANRDRGFATAKCGKLRWAPTMIPVLTEVPPESLAYLPAFEWASNEWNRVSERDLAVVEPLEREYVEAVSVIRGVVMIKALPKTPKEFKDHRAIEHFEFNEKTCEVVRGTITVFLDQPAELRRQIALHELGHVLLLDHDEDPASIMSSPNSWLSWTILPGDIERLKNLP